MTLRAALAAQADNNAALGSPFTARVLRLLAANLTRGTPLADRLFDWPGDVGPWGASLPLRLLGGLHALVLGGDAPGLAACYPPRSCPDDRLLWAHLAGALADHAAFLQAWIDRPPQTNEVRRAAALIAAGHWLTARFGLPLVLSELGASAGLNLNWDRYRLHAAGRSFGPAAAGVVLRPQWRGPVPPVARVRVAARRGVDLTPLDPRAPADRLRLLAYLWPDQPQRLALTRAAMALPPAPVDAGDAAPWLAGRLAKAYPGRLHVVFHTIAWQYFPPDTQAACTDHLQRAGARACAQAPLAHLSLEADGGDGALLQVTTWPGREKTRLARVDFHGRWVDWRAG